MEKYENPALNRVKFETPLNHRPLELVKDGKLQFAIVCDLAAEKNARIAGTDIPIKPACHSLHASSRYLQKYLERCFGEKPRILSPDSPELSSYPFKILLGKSIHTDKLGIDIMKMPPDGFKIMSYEGGIAIAGRDGSMIPGFYQWNDMGNYAANGTLCAVFDFLERFLGMRFYYPGLGVIAPKQNRLTLRRRIHRPTKVSDPFLRASRRSVSCERRKTASAGTRENQRVALAGYSGRSGRLHGGIPDAKPSDTLDVQRRTQSVPGRRSLSRSA